MSTLAVELTSNVGDLPRNVHHCLCTTLNADNIWQKVLDKDKKSRLYLSPEEIERIRLDWSDDPDGPASSLLRVWGKRGITVLNLLLRLQYLSKIYQRFMDPPQFALRRKFVPVIWSRSQQVIASTAKDNPNYFELKCHAKGFPYPKFQWIRDDEEIPGETNEVLLTPILYSASEYRCRVWNEVPDGMEYSSFYRSGDKQYRSELLSDVVDMTVSRNKIGIVQKRPYATDKVALIIGNRRYEHHVELSTPECDIEALTHALQNLCPRKGGEQDSEMFGYKTVQLSDLNLEEMQLFVREYKRLLGDGVYALFYFAGHGFEVAGECYLLPVDAPRNFRPEHCVSVNWIQQTLKQCTPSLNLVLLDICRKPPQDPSLFTEDAARLTPSPKVCPNSVFGFATSVGVCAFEARNEQVSVFMKYLLPHLHDPIPIVDVLNNTFSDIANDKSLSGVQVPELRTNLAAPCCLLDPIKIEGHTMSYESHTYHWRFSSELPPPINIFFKEKNLHVTVFFNLLGHFNNKMRVGSYIGEPEDVYRPGCDLVCTEWAMSHRAHFILPDAVDPTAEELVLDTSEGPTLYRVVSNLQRVRNGMKITIILSHLSQEESKAWAKPGSGCPTVEAFVAHALVNRIFVR